MEQQQQGTHNLTVGLMVQEILSETEKPGLQRPLYILAHFDLQEHRNGVLLSGGRYRDSIVNKSFIYQRQIQNM